MKHVREHTLNNDGKQRYDYSRFIQTNEESLVEHESDLDANNCSDNNPEATDNT